MATELPWMRSYLYVPGNRQRMLDKVFSAGADAVILDLEDAVPAGEKATARDMVAAVVRSRAGVQGPAVCVRINSPATGLAEDDVRAVVQPGLDIVRIAKAESADDVRQVAAWVDKAEAAAGMPAGSVRLMCSLEGGAAVYRAYEIATAHPRLMVMGFGAADYLTDMAAKPGPGQFEAATLYARSHIAIVSRAAGLRPPVDSVYSIVEDLDGLRAMAQQSRALGYSGKSVIHPKQVATVNEVYSPSEDELAWSREVIAATVEAEKTGSGAVRIRKEEMVDVAHVRRARDLLALAERLGGGA